MDETDPEAWPRVLSALSPRANLAFSQLNKEIWNSINVSLLKEELTTVRVEALRRDKSDLVNKIDEVLNKISEGTSKIRKTHCFYSCKDKGPFEVVIESSSNEIKDLNPLNIGKIIYNNSNYSDFNILNINRKGLRRVGVRFASADQANNFVKYNDFNPTVFEVYIPGRFVTVMGIVRDVGQDISDEEIISMGKGVNPGVQVIRVRRFNRRKTTENGISYVKTNTCVITFEGTTLPKFFELYSIRLPVELYIPPVVQCNKCWRYGHVRNLCRGKFRCSKCGSHHDDEKPCDSEPKCIFCQQDHLASDRKCPEYLRQTKMREIMALHNVSLYEADKACKRQVAPSPSDFPSFHKKSFERSPDSSGRVDLSYANIAARPKSPSVQNSQLNNPRQRPKRKAASQLGYDKEAHNACLFDQRPSFASECISSSHQEAGPSKFSSSSPIKSKGFSQLQSFSQASSYDYSQNEQFTLEDNSIYPRQIITYNEDYLKYGASSLS